MKIQVNSWNPEHYHWRGYNHAEILDVDEVRQLDNHPVFHQRVVLYRNDKVVRELENCTISLWGHGVIQIQGLPRDRQGALPHHRPSRARAVDHHL